MSVKPIIFSGPMVRALLDGRKTQTRRVLKPDGRPDGLEPNGEVCHYYGDHRIGACLAGSTHVQRIPHAPGDLLWVREAWRAGRGYDGASIRDMHPASRIWFEADDTNDTTDAIGRKLRPSIHMPRWASRLTLRVTDVRVQRVQEISEGDAWAEGCKPDTLCDDHGNPFPAEEPHPCGGTVAWDCARDWFADLWDSLNAKRGHGWDMNPWVAAYTFDVIRQNVEEVPA